MPQISVTVNKGDLVSESYKDSSIISDNITLTGNLSMVSNGKVTSFEGVIKQNITKEEIGNFSYRNITNSDIDHMSGDYYSSITIYREVEDTIQVEATNALLSGIVKLQEITI